MGFNIVLGGYMSIKRVADAVDADLWIPATVDNAVEVCGWVGLLWDSYGTPMGLLWDSYGTPMGLRV